MKWISIVNFLMIIYLFSSCDDPSEELKPDLSIGTAATGYQIKSQISNPRFEQPINFSNPKRNTVWIKRAWNLSFAAVTWDRGFGKNNSGGVSIDASALKNDIAITQTIKVDPAKLYRLKAWVKTENVQDGAGANVCIYDTWTHSNPVLGTNDWQEISVEFIPPSSGEVTIACRLGYWAATSLGKAFFDNVTIEESSRFVKLGSHIRLVLDPEDAEVVRPETIDTWVSNLDRAYETYYELMGGYPYSGEKITVMSVSEYPGGWAVAGNPILWYKPYIASTLLDIQSTGDWSFGILHELGHDFGLQFVNRNWVWHEEMFANFRMYYVVDKLNTRILLNNHVYVGTELENYYKTDAGDNYANFIAKGIPRGEDGVMYTLIRIKNIIGWDPFIKTYNELHASPVYGNDWEMFNLFLDKLTYYSGFDVRTTYLPGELETIKQLVISD